MPEDTRAHIRARSLRAGALLSDALGKVVDYDTIPRTAHGKPYIPGEPDFHFSISHSGNYLLLAICRTHEIGADLQEIRPVKPGIDAVASRFFSPAESVYLKKITDPAEKELTFFRLWSVKEAYLKYLGTGLAGNPAGFSAVIPPGGLAGAVRVRIKEDPFVFCTFPAPPEDGYVAAVCHPRSAEGITLRISRT
ncbi:MAG: 4'-phosphopantetheinyl transferase superfamily protein [Lachnospiraceae bacterium]|nr:4'-phosphopantetheinyl transferase superfamily protein [Lachnospiraceae bacterium]